MRQVQAFPAIPDTILPKSFNDLRCVTFIYLQIASHFGLFPLPDDQLMRRDDILFRDILSEFAGEYMCSAQGSARSIVPLGQIVDFEKAELRQLPFQDSLYLWVKGTLPAKGLDISLMPRLYSNGRPEYWGIEVTLCKSKSPANDTDDAIENLTFERSVPLAGITGIRGISVIGASREHRIEIDSEAF